VRRQQNPSVFQAEAAALVQAPVDYDSAKVREHAGVSFIVIDDDAMLKNGRYSGKKVSEIVSTVEGRDFLGGLWRTASPDLQKVIKKWFDS
jgi:hypothetical protein